MKELTTVEMEQVGGGLKRWAKALLGYAAAHVLSGGAV